MTARTRRTPSVLLATLAAGVAGLALLVPGGPATGVVATPDAAAPAPTARTAPALSREPVAVTGAVDRPRFYDVRSLTRRFGQQELTTTFTSGGVAETHTFSGPLLLDVATAVRPRFDAEVKNDQLAFTLTAIATDGYRAVVSWGELDPGFGATQVLLATHEDGVALERPRLVVPGDVKGGRYVSDVRRVVVRDLGR